MLLLTHRLPYAPNRGDRVRSFYLLRHLKSFATVDLVSLAHSKEEATYEPVVRDGVDRLRVLRVPHLRNRVRGAFGAVTTRTPLTHFLLDTPAMRSTLDALVAAGRPDVVLAYGSGMARFAIEPPLDRMPLVLDLVDVDSEKWRALAARSRQPRRWIYQREAGCLSEFEARVTARATATTVVNDREREQLAQVAPHARIHVVPTGADLKHLAPPGPPAAEHRVVFAGVMNYAPNVEAVQWFASRIWPHVRRRFPQARFSIVGSSPTAAVRALAGSDVGIEVTGSVPDIRPFLWSAAVSVAPILLSRGVQTKVVEAVAAGLAPVITTAVAGGLPVEILPACAVADTPAEFAAAVCERLSMNPEDRRRLASMADVFVLDWDRQLAPFRALLEAAIQHGARQSP